MCQQPRQEYATTLTTFRHLSTSTRKHLDDGAADHICLKTDGPETAGGSPLGCSGQCLPFCWLHRVPVVGALPRSLGFQATPGLSQRRVQPRLHRFQSCDLGKTLTSASSSVTERVLVQMQPVRMQQVGVSKGFGRCWPQ